MIYLFLSILCSTSLFVIFKYFNLYKINTLQAIVTNYVVAFSIGMYSADGFGKINTIIHQNWFYGALILSVLFIAVFFITALTSQKNGVAVASVAGKMSVIVPIIFGILLYKESITVLKGIGIVLALIAVYFSSVKAKETNVPKVGLLYPILLFLGSGIVDTTLKFVETTYVSTNDVSFFSGSLFGMAGTFGVLILIGKQFISKEKIALKNIIAGVVLGIPNYFSIVFLIKALQYNGFESSNLFTIINVGVVVLSAFVGSWLFKEHFSTKNKIGIIIAVLGIILVTIT